MSDIRENRLRWLWLVPVVLISALAWAHGDEDEHGGRVPYPKHPEPERWFSPTQECVEPEDVMKRDHMEFILHQRDETMHRGIRTTRHSLRECIACHAAKDEQGNYIPVNAPGQFCESCHSYASVKIDCWDCHATTPAKDPRVAGRDAARAAAPWAALKLPAAAGAQHP